MSDPATASARYDLPAQAHPRQDVVGEFASRLQRFVSDAPRPASTAWELPKFSRTNLR